MITAGLSVMAAGCGAGALLDEPQPMSSRGANIAKTRLMESSRIVDTPVILTAEVSVGVGRIVLRPRELEASHPGSPFGRRCALVGRKNRRRASLTGSPGIVIPTGKSTRQGA